MSLFTDIVYAESTERTITVYWGSCDEDNGEVIAFPKDMLYEGQMQGELGIVMIYHMSDFGFDPDGTPFDDIKTTVEQALKGHDNPRPVSVVE